MGLQKHWHAPSCMLFMGSTAQKQTIPLPVLFHTVKDITAIEDTPPQNAV